MGDKAVLVVDRRQQSGTLGAIRAAAHDVAAVHRLRIVHTIAAAGIDLEAVLDYVDANDVAVVITPGYRHIQNNPAWVRSHCDLVTMDPPAYQRRQRRLAVR